MPGGKGKKTDEDDDQEDYKLKQALRESQMEVAGEFEICVHAMHIFYDTHLMHPISKVHTVKYM